VKKEVLNLDFIVLLKQNPLIKVVMILRKVELLCKAGFVENS